MSNDLHLIHAALDEVMDEGEATAVDRVQALVSAYRTEKSRCNALSVRLAMRDQQLREADAMVARLRVDVDDLRLVAVRADMQRMALSERLGSTEPETAPEPWEAIVTAALRWRDGADRGELAAAVDALLGEYVGPQGSVAMVGGVLYPQKEALRPEQYADGAGAQAWRQAMGGKVCACAGELIGREQIHGVVKCSSGFESS